MLLCKRVILRLLRRYAPRNDGGGAMTGVKPSSRAERGDLLGVLRQGVQMDYAITTLIDQHLHGVIAAVEVLIVGVALVDNTTA